MLYLVALMAAMLAVGSSRRRKTRVVEPAGMLNYMDRENAADVRRVLLSG